MEAEALALWRAAHVHGRDGMTGRLKLEALALWALARGADPEALDLALWCEAEAWPQLEKTRERDRHRPGA